jgi:hypothetical protein
MCVATRMGQNYSSTKQWPAQAALIARSWALLAILTAALVLPSAACFAEDKIGNAVIIKNQVEGVTAAGTRPLTSGTEVYSDELVRTSTESKAELLFLDNTNLSVGPVSTIRLDKFVYDPNGPKGSVVVRAGIGTFRFITGLQDKKSYSIKTAYATLGVRGTEFYLLNTPSEVRLQLIGGEVFGTTISGQQFSVNQVNEVVAIDSHGQVHLLGIVNEPLVDFADLGTPIKAAAADSDGGGGGAESSTSPGTTGFSVGGGGSENLHTFANTIPSGFTLPSFQGGPAASSVSPSQP